MLVNNFSVSICVYAGDNSVFFDEALKSVIKQTVLPSEIVLVVDGPIPDEINKVIKKFSENLKNTDITFKVVRLEKNMGHGEARRTCFENCSFDYIALMDADDIAVPQRFEKQIKFLETHPELSVVGGYISEFIDNPLNCVARRVVPLSDYEIKKYMKKRCPMNQMTVMFRKQAIAQVGGYKDWFCNEDYYLWIRLALASYKFGNLPETLVNVRIGKEMYKRRGGYKYFKSEKKLQQFMLKNNIIGFSRFVINIGERFILQVVMPNKFRGIIFQKFARERIEREKN